MILTPLPPLVRVSVGGAPGVGLGRGGRSSLRVGPVKGSSRVQGHRVRDTRALSTARDQLRSHMAVPLKVSTSLKLCSLRVRGRVPPRGLSTASGHQGVY